MPVEFTRGNKKIKYLTVVDRLTSLHADHPGNVSIDTEVIDRRQAVDFEELRKQLLAAGLDRAVAQSIIDSCGADEVTMRATVTIHSEQGNRVFAGIARERQNLKDRKNVNYTSWIENCDTSAKGRAIAATGRHGGEYASADELASALQEAESDLITAVRNQREQLQEAEADVKQLKSTVDRLNLQIGELKRKPLNAPAINKANQTLSQIAQLNDSQERHMRLMTVCQGLVGDHLPTITELLQLRSDPLTRDQALRLLLICYLCSLNDKEKLNNG